MIGCLGLFFSPVKLNRTTRFARLFMGERLTTALFLIEVVKKPDTFMKIIQFLNNFITLKRH